MSKLKLNNTMVKIYSKIKKSIKFHKLKKKINKKKLFKLTLKKNKKTTWLIKQNQFKNK